VKPIGSLWTPSETAAVNARRVLPKLVQSYFKAGRKLNEESGPKRMHGFRLKTKELRYTLEAFAGLYGHSLEPHIAALRPIQNALGDFNDCEVLLAEMGDKLPNDARTNLKKRAAEKRKEFLKYWRKKFDAKDEDKKWKQYLTHSAPDKKTPLAKPASRAKQAK
jgi:CHAD domain-containing protein